MKINNRRRLGLASRGTHTVSAFQTTSNMKPASFGTANIPISTLIPKATTSWHRYTTGPTKKAKASNKPTTSTATKSASRER